LDLALNRDKPSIGGVKSSRVLPKVKRVAKKAALAAGVAAIGTALSELQPETKVGEQDASHDDKSNRGKTSEG
jgi:hypothetical protein